MARPRLVERCALALMVLGMLASLPWLVHPWYDPTNDGGMYLLTARSLLAGEGYAMLGIPFTIRPPGFSVLIAPLLAWRGTDFGALNTFVSLWGVAGCVAFYLWARMRLGWPLAWLLALYLWTNPGYQLLCNQPMSDVPGMALLLACLLFERRCARRPSWKRDLALGLFVSVTAYVRTINVLLVPAILGVRLLRRSTGTPEERAETWRSLLLRAGALGLGVLLVQLPWSLRNEAVVVEPPADQTLLYSYSTAFWNEDMGDPSSRRLSLREVLGRMPHRGAQALGVLGNRMTERSGGGTGDEPMALFFLGSLAIVLVKRRESPELFALGSTFLVSVYFGFAPRLMLPILVVALVAAAEVVRDVGRFLAGLRCAGEVAGRAGQVAASAGVLLLLATDARPRKDWDRIEAQHKSLTEICRRFAGRLEEDDVLASHRGWTYAVFLERPIYSLEFVVQRHLDQERMQLDTGPLEALIDEYGIDTVVLSPIRSPDREIVPYFEHAYGSDPDALARVYRVR